MYLASFGRGAPTHFPTINGAIVASVVKAVENHDNRKNLTILVWEDKDGSVRVIDGDKIVATIRTGERATGDDSVRISKRTGKPVRKYTKSKVELIPPTIAAVQVSVPQKVSEAIANKRAKIAALTAQLPDAGK